MQSLQQIEQEITELTTRIETDYPELYAFLNENPVTIPTQSNPKMNVSVMTSYLNDLRQLLAHHIKSHKLD